MTVLVCYRRFPVALDFAAMARPAEEWPLRSWFDASFDSFVVGACFAFGPVGVFGMSNSSRIGVKRTTYSE
jgi:hypothetical protein